MSALYSVWTDGACEPNPGIGGWGYLIRAHGDGGVIEACGGAQAVIYIDSTYVVNGLTVWRSRWRRRGWCKKTGAPMPNRDLWLLLEAQAMRAKLMRELVRSHIESLLPEHALAQAKIVEAEERKGLKIWARAMGRRHG